MMEYFDAAISITEDVGGIRHISIEGETELAARPVTVPGDPSSAAFLVAAALAVSHSDIMIENVGTNPLRTGFFETVRDMGANIAISNLQMNNGEPVADIRVQYSHSPASRFRRSAPQP